jgi:hypothetical protein
MNTRNEAGQISILRSPLVVQTAARSVHCAGRFPRICPCINFHSDWISAGTAFKRLEPDGSYFIFAAFRLTDRKNNSVDLDEHDNSKQIAQSPYPGFGYSWPPL